MARGTRPVARKRFRAQNIIPSGGHDENATLVALWCLRLLVSLGGYRQLSRFDYQETSVLEAIGLPQLDPREHASREDGGSLRDVLAERLAALESESPEPRGALAQNLAHVAGTLSLSAAETAVLAFAVLIHVQPALDGAGETLGTLSNQRTCEILDVVLGLPPGSARDVLAANAVLVRAGLLRLDPDLELLGMKLGLLHGLATTLTSEQADRASLLRGYVRLAPPPRLSAADYPHLQSEIALWQRYLTGVAGKAGVNGLLHGPSGTGKTQLARVLAKAMGRKLYEVPTTDRDGDPLEPAQRFRSYCLCQQLLARQPDALIAFDEIEDVFPVGFNALKGERNLSKAYLNEVLETNPAPVLWLSNAIWQMEPATLRRFRLALEVTAPTHRGRRQIVGKYLGHLPVSAPWLDRLAEHEELPPAVLEQVAEVAEELTGSMSEGLEDTLQRLLGQTLSAMGLRASLRKPAVEATPYRVDVLNTDADLAALTAALRHDPRGRLCLYGPPGTGKTAFGRYLAQVLDRPLVLKRASDLLSKWLGETEQPIARMFEEAERDDALLLLDEADSLLRERARAHVSWEVTQVNEILTQLEGFDGLFLCCTNLMEDLDAASLRRFDLKIHFDYLRPEQAWTLFREVVAAHGGRSPSARAWKTRLAALSELTPGDFATVVRRQRLTAGPLRAATLLNGLAREVWARRRDKGRGIGFAAPL